MNTTTLIENELSEYSKNSTHRYEITLKVPSEGDSVWRLSFFHYPNTPNEVYICAHLDGKRKYNIVDWLPNGTEIKYDEWVSLDQAREYWKFMVNVCDYKRTK